MKCTYLEYGSASGSLGGKVYSRNRYGPYIRARAVPVDPNSWRQQVARIRFQSMANHWSQTLTPAERTAWNLYAANVQMQGPLGQAIYLTGFNHFLRSNTAILQGGGSVVEAGPVIFSLPEADESFVPSISEAAQLISVAFDTNKDWVGEDGAHLLVTMSSPVGVGCEFIGGPYRYAGVVDGDSGTPPTSPQTIAVPFVVVETDKVIVKARIARADGRLSSPFLGTVTVAA